jgi:universal stress protein A
MGIFKNILLAVDLRVKHDASTISRAVALSKKLKATLHIIHVMEPIYGYGAVEGQILIEMEKNILDDIRKTFHDLASGYAISSDKLIIEIGSPKHIIVEQAKKLKVDLIIVGAHSKHGLNTVLGSTANAVINQAHCDVLTIRTLE